MIYLASPYSHDDPEVVRTRFEDALRATAVATALGYRVFSPIVHCHPLHLAAPDILPGNFEFWEEYDREMIAACDQVWVLKLAGWTDSKGIAAEVEIARELGIPVRHVSLNEIAAL